MPTKRKDDINEGGGGKNGWNLARVSMCELKKSAKGDAYYNIVLETPDGTFLAYDVLMLEGPGNGIGFAKLYALGAAEDLGDEVRYDEPREIEGRCAWVYLTTETWQGKRRRKVDISQGRAGYLPESETPPESGGMDGDADDIPFGAPPDDGAPEYDDDSVPF